MDVEDENEYRQYDDAELADADLDPWMEDDPFLDEEDPYFDE